MDSTMTTKGQVTIPKAMRDYLSLEPGDKVVFAYLEGGGIRIEPAKRSHARKLPKSRFAALRGRASGDIRTDELMRLLRGYADDPKDPGFRK
jgi:antitoxin PrlF